MKHPAKYSDCLLPIFKEMLVGCDKILDPFAGTGKLRNIFPNSILLEIEPEWAKLSNAIVGDATQIPFNDNMFDAICTSPTYGNRMADHHEAKDTSQRNTYRHILGRPLSTNNSGKLQWGKDYKTLHIKAWKECFRVLKSGGLFCLNISNHIRKGIEIDVTGWHIETLISIGFSIIEHRKVETKRQRMGKNGNLRVQYESIVLFKKKRLNHEQD